MEKMEEARERKRKGQRESEKMEKRITRYTTTCEIKEKRDENELKIDKCFSQNRP